MKRILLSGLIGAGDLSNLVGKRSRAEVTPCGQSSRSKTREKESAMNIRIHYTAYSLIGISIVLILLLAYPDVNRSRAKVRASGPIASSASRVGGMEDVRKETTFTPPPAGLKTWVVSHEWHNDRWNCPGFRGGAHAGGVSSDVSEVLVGYVNSYDGGSGPLPCESNSKDIYQGTIWFDLSEIFNKPPFPRADTAILKFKKVAGSVAAYDGNRKPITKVCADRLFVSNGDSMKGFPEGTLVPEGDLLKDISECLPEGCSIEVKDLVNNWITGKIDRNGFVIAGEDEEWLDKLIPHDSSVCQTRYSDFSLTVKYRYSKTDIPVSKTPPGPGTLDTRKNVALASNGGVAYASSKFSDSFSPDRANDGEHKGLGGASWQGAGPTNNDWLQIDFKGIKTIDEIDVFMVQDNYVSPIEPDESTPATMYGLQNFRVQYWSPFGAWEDVPVPGNPVTDYKTALKKFKLPDLKTLRTRQIRVLVSKTRDGWSRLTEVEAWGK